MKKPKDFDAIKERIATAENWRDSTYRDEWEKFLLLYRSRPKRKNPASGSNIFVPYTFMQCEVIKARLTQSLFNSRPYVTLIPRRQENGQTAHSAQVLLDWQFNERMRIRKLIADDVLSDLVTFGTAVTFTGWQKKTRKTKGMEMVSSPLLADDGTQFLGEDGMPMSIDIQQLVERDTVVYDDPIVQKVDLFDFYTDPHSTNTNDARYCGHREWLTKEEIQNMEETADWDVDWKNLQPDDSGESGKKIRADVMGSTIMDGSDDFTKDDAKGLYLVHHYWEDGRHVVIINNQECALDEENPFWHGMKPYDKVCYVPLTNEFYGIGIPETLQDLQAELNTSRNQRIDFNTMSLRRMWKMRKGCGLTEKDLVWRANGIIQVEEMDDLQEINVQGLPASAFSNEEIIKKDMRDATGCHDIVMGLSTTADETATTTATKDNNASLRFKYIIEDIVDNLLIPIARKCISLDQQFMDMERQIRVTDDPQFGEYLFTITPQDLMGDYDMSYVGSSVEPIANKENYKSNMLQAYSLAVNNPLVQNDPQAMTAMLRELFTALEIKDVDNLLPSTENTIQKQVAAVLEQKLSQRQSSGSQQGSMEAMQMAQAQ